MPEKKSLIRYYHTLCHQLRLTPDNRLALLEAYGTDSSTNLTCQQLTELCRNLQDRMPRSQYKRECSDMRRRLMAAIAAYLRESGTPHTQQTIIQIACRAARQKHFADIPLERLRTLIYAFNNKTKDLQEVDRVTEELNKNKFIPII